MTLEHPIEGVETEPAGATSDYRFAPIPEALLYDGTLSPTCVRVYGCLQRHGLTPDSCYPSHARIAGCLGLSERSVARPLAELEKAGWIARTRRHNGRGERIADGYHVRSTPIERAGSRSTTTQSSAAPPRNPAHPYHAETRGLEKQREPGEREPENETSSCPSKLDHTLPNGLSATVQRSPHLQAARALCDILATMLVDKGVKPTPNPATKAWIVPMEAILRIDGRTPEQVLGTLQWLHAGTDGVATWWQPVIMSPSSLREHWPKMEMQYRRARQGGSGKAAAIHTPGEKGLRETLREMRERPAQAAIGDGS